MLITVSEFNPHWMIYHNILEVGQLLHKLPSINDDTETIMIITKQVFLA